MILDTSLVKHRVLSTYVLSFEKAHILSTYPRILFFSLHPKHLTITITHHYDLSLSNLLQTLHILSLRNLSFSQKLVKTLAMAKKQNQPQVAQAKPNFRNSPPFASSEEESPYRLPVLHL